MTELTELRKRTLQDELRDICEDRIEDIDQYLAVELTDGNYTKKEYEYISSLS